MENMTHKQFREFLLDPVGYDGPEVTAIELTEVFGKSNPTKSPENHVIADFLDGIQQIESGKINGFECYAGNPGEPYHPFQSIYRVRRWGDSMLQFKVSHNGLEGSGIYEKSWEDLFSSVGNIISCNDSARFRAI